MSIAMLFFYSKLARHAFTFAVLQALNCPHHKVAVKLLFHRLYHFYVWPVCVFFGWPDLTVTPHHIEAPVFNLANPHKTFS
jgi:hypothetical protein